MTPDLKIRVQWSRGAVLPVLTRGDATTAELSRLLRFACTPNDEVILIHNGIPLDPDRTLENQMIKDNDIIQALVVKRTNGDDDGLAAKIDSIVLEAARVSDRRFDALEMAPYRPTPRQKSSSDDDLYDFYDEETDDRRKIFSISSEPLPAFWNEQKETDNTLNRTAPSKFCSIEEAGDFLEKRGWSSWMW